MLPKMMKTFFYCKNKQKVKQLNNSNNNKTIRQEEEEKDKINNDLMR